MHGCTAVSTRAYVAAAASPRGMWQLAGAAVLTTAAVQVAQLLEELATSSASQWEALARSLGATDADMRSG